MIISEAIQYAKRNGLGMPGYAPKTAKFVLVCDSDSGDTPVEDDFSFEIIGDPDDKKNK